MSPELVLYLIDVAMGVSFLFLILAISALVVALIWLNWWDDVYGSERDSKEAKEALWIPKKYFCLGGALIIFCILIPSQKTLYAMASVHYLKDSTIPEKVLKAIDLNLDDYIKKEGKK